MVGFGGLQAFRRILAPRLARINTDAHPSLKLRRAARAGAGWQPDSHFGDLIEPGGVGGQGVVELPEVVGLKRVCGHGVVAPDGACPEVEVVALVAGEGVGPAFVAAIMLQAWIEGSAGGDLG